ncbi:ribonuclease [Sphingosinicella humi]|uniref:Ribonuclease n=1 Tax=Allosphingosinicella humi TaxID=2068657 RepID=A0A2U2J1Z4_9SPHN|nr:ribonuclease [Sphingosinicella humi]PWG02346.1 ribonuclease [Sphingosinicella humi]
MAEWLYEEGIGENRAALVEDDIIVEAAIELPDELRAGTVAAARLTKILIPARRAVVTLAQGGQALMEPVPAKLSEGAALHVEIVREAIAEPGRPKLPKARATDMDERAGASLLERLSAGGAVTRLSPFGQDRLEQAGWSELMEEALGGEIAFPGGALRMSLTPAMTLFDVDGALPPDDLAVAGAEAAGRAIRKFGIGGSIGIDLPTLSSKEERQKAAAALDAVLPQPFERTAVNGFGFLQIVRKRARPSLPELLQGDPVGAAARILLRRAERSDQSGGCVLHAAPPVVARIEAKPDWVQALSARIGGGVALQPEPGLAISAGHVHSRQS